MENIEKLTTLFRAPDGRLSMPDPDKAEGDPLKLRMVRCFPWSASDSWLSLRTDDNDEVALLPSLESIKDVQIRKLLADELAERTYIPRIEAISEIVEDSDIFRWQVMTDAGSRLFYTARRQIPREVPGGGVIIRDIGGDRYFIANIEKLDSESRNWLWIYLD